MFPHGFHDLRSRLSGADAISLLELIGRCLASKGEEDFRALFPKIREILPFDYAIAVLAENGGNPGSHSDYSVNISFPEGWLREFQAKRGLWGSDQAKLLKYRN